jgi:hypothetical protein
MKGESIDEPYHRMNCMMIEPGGRYHHQTTLNHSYEDVEALDEVYFLPTDFIGVKRP